jgi:hypothetical protein
MPPVSDQPDYPKFLRGTDAAAAHSALRALGDAQEALRNRPSRVVLSLPTDQIQVEQIRDLDAALAEHDAKWRMDNAALPELLQQLNIRTPADLQAVVDAAATQEPRSIVARFIWTGHLPEWLVRGSLTTNRGRLEICRLEVLSLQRQPVGLGKQTLRDISTEEILIESSRHLQVFAAADEARKASGHPERDNWKQAGAAAASDPSHRGRKRLSDEFIRSVAEAFLDEMGPGVYSRLAVRLRPGGRKPTEKQLEGWVRRATQDEWLSPGRSGSSYRSPGPRLIAARQAEAKQ